MIGVLVTIAQPRDPQHEQRPPWCVGVVHHMEPSQPVSTGVGSG